MFFFLPVGMNYETRRLPIVTFTLMGINTLVYLISLICFFATAGDSDLWIREHLWLIPGTSNALAYVTSMFVHANWLHLLGNMIFLFLFGCCTEDMIGRLRFTLVYLVSGFAADMVFIASTPEHFSSLVPMGGASGAISGCMGMYLLLRAKSQIEFKYFYFFFLFGAGGGDFMLPAWVAITFWFLRDLVAMLLTMQLHVRSGTAFGAHVGGFLAGMTLVGLYRLVAQKKEMAEEEVAAPRPNTALPARQIAAQAQPRARIRIQNAPATPATSSPPTETPSIFLALDGQQTGPFTLTNIQEMLHQQTITTETLYWSEGMTEWRSVAELAG